MRVLPQFDPLLVRRRARLAPAGRGWGAGPRYWYVVARVHRSGCDRLKGAELAHLILLRQEGAKLPDFVPDIDALWALHGHPAQSSGDQQVS